MSDPDRRLAARPDATPLTAEQVVDLRKRLGIDDHDEFGGHLLKPLFETEAALRSALAEREAECARLRAVIANQLTQHMEASGEYSSAPTPGAET